MCEAVLVRGRGQTIFRWIHRRDIGHGTGTEQADRFGTRERIVCYRLIIAVLALLVSAGVCNAANYAEEEDLAAGQLVAEINRILRSKPALDSEARVALGASLEFLFLQLQRSKTRAAFDGVARSVVFHLDGGGSESRTDAILSKGKPMISRLKKVMTRDYQEVCRGAMLVACQSETETADDVARFGNALTRGRIGRK